MSGRYTGFPVQPPPYFQPSYFSYTKNPYQYSYEAVPSPLSDLSSPYSAASTPGTPYVAKPWTKQHKRRCIDYATTLTLFMVWAFLTIGCIVLLYFSHVATSSTSEDGVTCSSSEIARIIGLSSAPILIATILNEVLVDRCWRRVVYSALGNKASTLDNEDLARNLRAANFGWVNFVKRMFKARLSRQDMRSLASYGLLRWGTAISIASVQLCVSWNPADLDADTGQYTASKRYIWLLGPVILHACSIFGTMLIWLMPPWRFFSDRFQDAGLLKRYMPYLDRVRGGCVASYDAVAELLDPRAEKLRTLERKNSPGIQFFAKLNGIWLGLIGMNVPPALAWAFFQYVDSNDILRFGVYRFALHFVFLAQNIFYLLALDFAVWNVSIEGFCKRTRGRPNKNLRHLGYSSGIMLLVKAFKQRRPVRAAIFLWLFWLQACLMRFLTVLYVLCVTVLSYGSYDDRDEFYDPQFWLAWLLMTAFFVVPLFLIWLFTMFQAPICEQDGWRWAKIARNALCEPGYYGVRGREAVWGMDVEPFESCKGRTLL